MLSFLQASNPIIGLIINVSVHILCFREVSGLGLLKAVFIGFGAGALSVLFLEFHIYLQPASTSEAFLYNLLTNLIIYSLLGYGYFHFVNLSETARRIRIVRELYENPAGLSLDEILARYNSKAMVEMRINRLLGSGQIIYKNGKYFIGKRFVLLIAQTIVFLKLLVLGKKSEFH